MPAITTIKLRRGTAAQWTSANPVLAAGEIGLETDTRRTKYGNGSQAWSALPYSVADTSGIATVDWSAVTGKPATFPPTAHAASHGIGGSDEIEVDQAQVYGLLTSLAGKSDVEHTHLIAEITDYDRTAGTVLSDTAPASPVAGLKWVKTTTMQQYIYFDSTWVEI